MKVKLKVIKVNKMEKLNFHKNIERVDAPVVFLFRVSVQMETFKVQCDDIFGKGFAGVHNSQNYHSVRQSNCSFFIFIIVQILLIIFTVFLF